MITNLSDVTGFDDLAILRTADELEKRVIDHGGSVLWN